MQPFPWNVALETTEPPALRMLVDAVVRKLCSAWAGLPSGVGWRSRREGPPTLSH